MTRYARNATISTSSFLQLSATRRLEPFAHQLAARVVVSNALEQECKADMYFTKWSGAGQLDQLDTANTPGIFYTENSTKIMQVQNQAQAGCGAVNQPISRQLSDKPNTDCAILLQYKQ